MSEPDEAAVEAVRDVVRAWLDGTTGGRYTDEVAHAVLATPVVADAFAAVVFREKVAEILADNPRQPAYAVRRIAALLAGDS